MRYGHYVRVVRNTQRTFTTWGYITAVLFRGFCRWQVRGLDERTHCWALGPVVWGYKTNRRWNEDL